MSDSNNNINPLPNTPSSSSSSNKLSLFDSSNLASSSHSFDDSFEFFDDNQPIWCDHMDLYVPQQSQSQSQSQTQLQPSFEWASVTSPNFLYEDPISPTEKLKALAFKKSDSFPSDLHTIQPKDILKDHPMHDCYHYMEPYECPPPHHPVACVVDNRSKVELYRQEDFDSDDDEEDDEVLFEEPSHIYCEEAVMDTDNDEPASITIDTGNNVSHVVSSCIPISQHQHHPASSSSSSSVFSPSLALSLSSPPESLNVVSPTPPPTTSFNQQQLDHNIHQKSLIIPPPSASTPFKHAKKRSISQSTTHRCEHINPVTGKPCNKVFSRPYDLIRHQDTIHAKVRKTFRCEMCGDNSKTFSRMDALSRHIRVKHSK